MSRLKPENDWAKSWLSTSSITSGNCLYSGLDRQKGSGAKAAPKPVARRHAVSTSNTMVFINK